MSRTFGQNIREARIAAGIKTQGDFAKRLGVPQPQVSDWENDRYKGGPKAASLLRIAAGIPCELEVLVRGVDANFDQTRTTAREVKPAAPDPELVARLRELEAAMKSMRHVTEQLVSTIEGPDVAELFRAALGLNEDDRVEFLDLAKRYAEQPTEDAEAPARGARASRRRKATARDRRRSSS